MTNPLHTSTKQQRTRLAAPDESSRARFGPKRRNTGENKEPKHALNEKRNNPKNKETKTRKCQYQKMQGYITKTKTKYNEKKSTNEWKHKGQKKLKIKTEIYLKEK